MISLRDLFAPGGRIGRAGFALGAAVVLIVFAILIRATQELLPWMATVLAPRGINAGFALNLLWLVLGAVLVWSLSALSAKRLRDLGRWPWWGAVAVVALAALALVNDAIFLVSRSFTLPSAVQWPLLTLAGGIALWVLAEGLLRPGPGRPGEAEPR